MYVGHIKLIDTSQGKNLQTTEIKSSTCLTWDKFPLSL